MFAESLLYYLVFCGKNSYLNIVINKLFMILENSCDLKDKLLKLFENANVVLAHIVCKLS